MTGLKQDWGRIAADLDDQGWALLPGAPVSTACMTVGGLYDWDDGFRSRVVMARHGFGRGEYRYFSYPLPPMVEDLRTRLYPSLAPSANGWMERLGQGTRFPDQHARY